ncbi:hypothetical protein C8R44DRAFT_992663 [Mycena epipterygia]|nr:hypothetical protein C8R44DRAFT_992663 [Mycena epipterygia]
MDMAKQGARMSPPVHNAYWCVIKGLYEPSKDGKTCDSPRKDEEKWEDACSSDAGKVLYLTADPDLGCICTKIGDHYCGPDPEDPEPPEQMCSDTTTDGIRDVHCTVKCTGEKKPNGNKCDFPKGYEPGADGQCKIKCTVGKQSSPDGKTCVCPEGFEPSTTDGQKCEELEGKNSVIVTTDTPNDAFKPTEPTCMPPNKVVALLGKKGCKCQLDLAGGRECKSKNPDEYAECDYIRGLGKAASCKRRCKDQTSGIDPDTDRCD